MAKDDEKKESTTTETNDKSEDSKATSESTEKTDSNKETTTSSSNTDSEDIKVGDYGIFSDAIASVDSLKSDIESQNEILTNNCTKLSDETIFMGPICDSCVDGFSKVGSKITTSIEQLGKFHTYFVDTAKNYQAGDKSTTSLIIGSSGNTQATDLMALGDRANNGDKEAQKEWLDKMAAIVKPYCDKYGFPDSVVLAQLIQESGWSKSGSWLNENNNVLNVNTTMWGNNDYKVSKDGVVNENADMPKWTTYRSSASGGVSGGANFENPHEASMRSYNSVEDCVEDYLALMVGYRPELNGSNVDSAIEGIKHYAEDASYSERLHSHINNYDLTQYDV